MKSLLQIIVLFLAGMLCPLNGGELVLPYSAFGPQAMSHELIGMEWWQWDSQGDDDPRSSPPIKVVVYWDQSLDKTKLQYPVDREKERDFRYVEYSAAVSYFGKVLKELDEMAKDEPAVWLEKLRDDLTKTSAMVRAKHDERKDK